MPYVNVWIDEDDLLDELDDDYLISKLKNRGYSCFKSGSSGDDGFLSVEHLLDCGFKKEAREEALLIVGKTLGRSL